MVSGVKGRSVSVPFLTCGEVWEGRRYFVVLWLGLSLLRSLSPAMWTLVLLSSSPLLTVMGWLHRARVEYFPSPRCVALWWNSTRLDSGKIVYCGGSLCQEEKKAMACFTKVLFPLSARSTWGFFSDIDCEDLGEPLVIKFTKVWNGPHA